MSYIADDRVQHTSNSDNHHDAINAPSSGCKIAY